MNKIIIKVTILLLIYGCDNDTLKNKKTEINVKQDSEIMKEVVNDTSYVYYKNGNLHYTNPYKNNEIHGITTYYYEDGSIKKTVPVIEGIVNGMVYTYYNNGALMLKENYMNGKRNGYSYLYYKKGAIRSKVPFVNDKIDGVAFYYYENGNPEKICTQLGDKIWGRLEEYDSIGNVLTQIISLDSILLYRRIYDQRRNLVMSDGKIPKDRNDLKFWSETDTTYENYFQRSFPNSISR